MKELIIITYSIALLLFILALFYEKEITVLDLFKALGILVIPFANVIVFAINFYFYIKYRKQNDSIRNEVKKFFNYRIK